MEETDYRSEHDFPGNRDIVGDKQGDQLVRNLKWHTEELWFNSTGKKDTVQIFDERSDVFKNINQMTWRWSEG